MLNKRCAYRPTTDPIAINRTQRSSSSILTQRCGSDGVVILPRKSWGCVEVVHLAQRWIWSDLVAVVGRWDDDQVLVGSVRHCVVGVLTIVVGRQRWSGVLVVAWRGHLVVPRGRRVVGIARPAQIKRSGVIDMIVGWRSHGWYAVLCCKSVMRERKIVVHVWDIAVHLRVTAGSW